VKDFVRVHDDDVGGRRNPSSFASSALLATVAIATVWK
jgi:hypothetical protein